MEVEGPIIQQHDLGLGGSGLSKAYLPLNVKMVQELILYKAARYADLRKFWTSVYAKIQKIQEERSIYFPNQCASQKSNSPNRYDSCDRDWWNDFGLNSIRPYLQQIFLNKGETKLLMKWLRMQVEIPQVKSSLGMVERKDEAGDGFQTIDLSQTTETLDEDASHKNKYMAENVDKPEWIDKVDDILSEINYLLAIILSDKTFGEQRQIFSEITSIIDNDSKADFSYILDIDRENQEKLTALLKVIKENNWGYIFKDWWREMILKLPATFDISVSKGHKIEKSQLVYRAKKIILNILEQNPNIDENSFKDSLFEFIQRLAKQEQGAGELRLTRAFDVSLDDVIIEMPATDQQLRGEFGEIFEEFNGTMEANTLYNTIKTICSDRDSTDKFSVWVREHMLEKTMGKYHDISMLCNFFANAVLSIFGSHGVYRENIFNLQRKKIEKTDVSDLNRDLHNTISESTSLMSVNAKLSSSAISTTDAQTITKVNELLQEKLFYRNRFKAQLQRLYNTIKLVIDWEQYKVNQGGEAREGWFTPMDHTKAWNRDSRIDNNFYNALLYNQDLMAGIRRLCQHGNDVLHRMVGSLPACIQFEPQCYINYETQWITNLKERLYRIISKDFFGAGGEINIVDILNDAENDMHTIGKMNKYFDITPMLYWSGIVDEDILDAMERPTLNIRIIDEMRRRLSIALQKLSMDIVKRYKSVSIDLLNQEKLNTIYVDVGQNKEHGCFRGGANFYNADSGIGDKEQAESIPQSFYECFEVERNHKEELTFKFTIKEDGLTEKNILTFLVGGFQDVISHHGNRKRNWIFRESPSMTGLTISSLGAQKSYRFSKNNKQMILTTNYCVQVNGDFTMTNTTGESFNFSTENPVGRKILEGDIITFVDTFELERNNDNQFQVKVNLVKSAVKYTYTENCYGWSRLMRTDTKL